ADAGDEDDPLAREPELRHEALNRSQDRVVAAPWAPANLLVGLEVLRGQLDEAVAVLTVRAHVSARSNGSRSRGSSEDIRNTRPSCSMSRNLQHSRSIATVSASSSASTSPAKRRVSSSGSRSTESIESRNRSYRPRWTLCCAVVRVQTFSFTASPRLRPP